MENGRRQSPVFTVLTITALPALENLRQKSVCLPGEVLISICKITRRVRAGTDSNIPEFVKSGKIKNFFAK